MYTEGVVIKQLWRWAKKRRLILDNALEDVRLQKPKLVPKAGPTLDQINTILTATRGEFRAMLAVLAFTGMRSGELQRLLIDDRDLLKNWMHVVSRPGAETKTHESRKIPIHPRLRALLTGLPMPAGRWLFNAKPSAKYPEGGHWISPKKLNERFQAILKKLKLPVGRDAGFTVHSLRHSFETICVNAGIPQRVVDAWLGHTSDRSMAAVYYRLSDEESQKFMLMVPFGTGVSAADVDKEKAS